MTHPPELSVVCPIFSGALWQFSWTMCWSRIFASTWSGGMLTTCIAYLHCMWIYSISFIDLKGFLGYYYIIYRKNVENLINNSEMLHSGWKSHFLKSSCDDFKSYPAATNRCINGSSCIGSNSECPICLCYYINSAAGLIKWKPCHVL